MGFSRQEYWNGLLFPSPGDLSNPGIKPRSSTAPAVVPCPILNCSFLTCIRVSQEAGQVVWYSHLFKNVPQFVVMHTVKGFGVVNEAEVFLIHCCYVISEVKSLGCVQLFATPWTVAFQAPPSLGFSRQEYWNGLPFPSPGDLPNPGIEPRSPAS